MPIASRPELFKKSAESIIGNCMMRVRRCLIALGETVSFEQLPELPGPLAPAVSIKRKTNDRVHNQLP
jgi:hypothetical protein